MMSEEMNLDMNTLTAFSEKDREYFQYQARQEYLRVQRTIERDREERRLEMEQTAHEWSKQLLGWSKQRKSWRKQRKY